MQRRVWQLLMILVLPAVAAGQSVELTRVSNGDVRCTVDGKLFTIYRLQDSQPKPYFYPVLGPAGKPMTYVFPPVRPKRGEYHPHHRSLWIAVDEVNGVAFWAERGKIRNRSIQIVKPKGSPAVFVAVNDWLAPDGAPVVRERTTYRVYADRMIGIRLTFEAAYGDVTFGDTKEGLLGVRVNPQIRERTGGGSIVNALGAHGERDCWGRRAPWVDYYGTIDGVVQGIAIFDHPANFRPSRWHVRGYGLFAVNPFGERAYTRGKNPPAPVTLQKGQSLTLRYGVYFHSGGPKEGNVAERYRLFVKQMSSSTAP